MKKNNRLHKNIFLAAWVCSNCNHANNLTTKDIENFASLEKRETIDFCCKTCLKKFTLNKSSKYFNEFILPGYSFVCDCDEVTQLYPVDLAGTKDIKCICGKEILGGSRGEERNYR